MEKKKSLRITLITAAIIVISMITIIYSNAYMRDTITIAFSQKDAALVTIDKESEKPLASASSLDYHFGSWIRGDELNAEMTFDYTGNIAAFIAPQLDIKDNEGKNCNDCFEGKYTIVIKEDTSDKEYSKEYNWKDEQTSQEIAKSKASISVIYKLKMINDLVEGRFIVPEFNASALQAVNNNNLEASFRKISSGDQKGFSDIADHEIFLAEDGELFDDEYGKNKYTAKKLSFSVTPDNKDADTMVNVYKYNNPNSTESFKNEINIITNEKIMTGKKYQFAFMARKGMQCKVITDASNEKAGHSVYSYDITWDENNDNPSVVSTELDKNGEPLKKDN